MALFPDQALLCSPLVDDAEPIEASGESNSAGTFDVCVANILQVKLLEFS